MVHKSKKSFLKKDKVKDEFQNESSNTVAGSEEDHGRPSKKARIIIRNLPFKNLSEKSVENLFKEYGDIEEVKLLKKDDGKFVGCGFVQFKKVTSAAKAIHYVNQKELRGRKVIVDWALPKNTFLEKVTKLEEDPDIKTIKTEVLSDEDEIVDFSIDKRPDTWKSESESESDEKDVKYKEDNETDSEKEDDDDSNDNNDDMDEDEDEDEDEDDDNYHKNKSFDKESSKTIHPKNSSSDVQEGRTVFVRNVPFSATNEDLHECMEKYGPVEYAIICVDKLTEHSKGSAFVKFKDRENAIQCIKDSMKIFLNDSPLSVTIAVSKENLEEKKKAKKTAKDSRNLYLVREGVIIAGSKSAMGVSASDMAKRLQLEQWKSQILKNLNMFVSKTRLVIHNLPVNFDDEKLRKLFKKYSNPKAIIKEAKVMRHKKNIDYSGIALSKEVGFVSFTNHDDALTALRNINNNPDVFGPKKRPIVAFSIENRAVINAKQRNMEKSRIKLGIVKSDKPDKLSKLNRKQRRFLRRREKFIARRKERQKLRMSENPDSKTNVVNIKKETKKRKIEAEASSPSKKLKLNPSEKKKDSSKEFTGIISEPGKPVKLRSKYKLKTQAKIHSETLKQERRKRRVKERKKMGSTKQPKQKMGKKKLLDDEKLSKIISRHRESIQNSSSIKKWYET